MTIVLCTPNFIGKCTYEQHMVWNLFWHKKQSYQLRKQVRRKRFPYCTKRCKPIHSLSKVFHAVLDISLLIPLQVGFIKFKNNYVASLSVRLKNKDLDEGMANFILFLENKTTLPWGPQKNVLVERGYMCTSVQ